jgi:hypothetical protein
VPSSACEGLTAAFTVNCTSVFGFFTFADPTEAGLNVALAAVVPDVVDEVEVNVTWESIGRSES